MPFSRGKAILFSVFSSRFTSKNALTSAVYANFGLIAFIRLSRQVFFCEKNAGKNGGHSFFRVHFQEIHLS